MKSNQKPLHTRLSARSRENIYTDLSTLLNAGIPILESLDSMEKDATGSTKKVLIKLREAIDNGEDLSSAMEHMPHAFDAININLIKAAEASGTLEETLEDLVKITKKDMAFSSQLKTAMIYPMFVMTIFTGIVLLMLTFVIPRVAKTFLSLHVKLPLITRVMFTSSAYFLQHWIAIIAGIVAGVILLIIFASVQRKAIIRFILSLPGLKILGRDIDLRRFTRSFQLLLHAGLPLDEVLELSERVVQKKQMAIVVSQMKANITTGKPLSTGLRDHKKAIPTIVARSVETAEQSGTLEKTMQRLSEHFDEQVDDRLKLISTMMEPILLVVIGVMVGFLMVGIMGPMYGLMSQVETQTSQSAPRR